MNFFKSLLLDEEEESSSSDLESDQNPNSESPQSNPDQKRSNLDDQQQEEEEETEIDQNPSSMGWNFGRLIKNIATKSESVLQTYRQDLSDFSSGLKIETSIIREAASRTFESGTSVAAESLESVGQAMDDFGSSVWIGTSEIISQGKETLLSSPDFDEQFSTNSMKYNRFEAQLYAIQTDLNTYCVNPEDLDDFEGWKSGFVLGEKSEEIECLLNENKVMERVYTRIVPSEVDDGTFWYRYFYRVYKVKQVEDARASLVKRAIEGDEEEDLSWDVDDDDEEVEVEVEGKGIELPVVDDDSVENEELSGNGIGGSRAGNGVESAAEVGGNKDLVVELASGNAWDEKGIKLPVANDGSVENKELRGNDIGGSRAGNGVESAAEVGGNKDLVVELASGNVWDEKGIELPVVDDDSVENEELSGNVIGGSRAGNGVESAAEVGGNKDLVVELASGNVWDEKGVVVIEGCSELNSDDLVERVDEKLVIQGMSENGGESGKDSDFSVVSSQPALPNEEEDLSWDEIEDLGDSGEKKVSADGRATLAKRLTVADEDEDLSWDIEDDCEILISGKRNI